jgi:RND family efflux transporter MFP subunit
MSNSAPGTQRTISTKGVCMKLYLSLTITAVLIAGCSHPQEIVPQPTPVTVQVVHGAAADGGVRYSANIKPDIQVDVSFKVNGYVEQILQIKGTDGRNRNVQEGDQVRKGTVLARIRDNEYRDRLNEAQAALTKARSDFNRAAQLFENQNISKADYDAARAQLESATARYNQADQSLKDCAIVSPIDGFIIKKNIEVGTLVSPGMPGFTAADTRSVKAEFGVPDIDVVSMKMGSQQTVITDALPGVEFRGKISRIAPSADPSSRVFEVECTIPNPDGRLKSGMIASLKLIAHTPTAQPIVIPLNSIVRPKNDPNGYAVFVVEHRDTSDVAVTRTVSLGDVVGNMITVVSGLQGGEKVVVRGATIVPDSGAVRVIPG